MPGLGPPGVPAGPERRSFAVAALAPVSVQLLSALPTPGMSLTDLLLIGLPAWAFAIFTLALWYFRHRRTPDGGPPPTPPADLAGGDGA